MHRGGTTVALAVSWLLIGCETQRPTVSGAPPTEMLAVAISSGGWPVAMLLDSTVPIDASRAQGLAFAESSPTFGPELAGPAGLTQAREAIRSLLTAPQQRAPLPAAGFAALGMQPTSQVPELSRARDRSIVFSVSVVGYSADSTIAAIYSEFYCGAMCAGGVVSILKRTGARSWQLLQTRTLWQS